MITPASLKTGDTIAIVSPAGALRDPSIAEQAATTLRSWGLEVKFALHCFTRHGYYSGTRQERMEDLASSLADGDVKAILCSYGGYGCVHLLEDFFPLIAEHPKWLIGMSDVSALHSACVAAGIQSLHAPQCRHIGNLPHSRTTELLRRILFGEKPVYKIPTHPLNINGEAKGILVGGNLSVLAALAGSRYDIFTEGRIIFIEDTGELPYRIERMMYQLKLSGALKKISGLIVGSFTGAKEHDGFGGSDYELIHNIMEEYEIPVCFNFPVGHCDENVPLIEGAEVTLSVSNEGVILRTL